MDITKIRRYTRLRRYTRYPVVMDDGVFKLNYFHTQEGEIICIRIRIYKHSERPFMRHYPPPANTHRVKVSSPIQIPAPTSRIGQNPPLRKCACGIEVNPWTHSTFGTNYSICKSCFMDSQ